MNKQKKTTIFHYQDLEIETGHDVYDPAEDTFLLLETVHVNPTDAVLELGTGCGLIALAYARLGASVVCTDINPSAVQLTKRNIQRNRPRLNGTIDVRQGDLFSVITTNERFDVIMFNPPYLPTSSEEKTDAWLSMAVDGGADGLQVTKRFLDSVKNYLKTKGRIYFLFSSLSDRNSLERYLDDSGFTYERFAGYVFDSEEINVYGATPKH